VPGIGVIVNPHARGNRRAPRRLDRFRRIVGDDGEVVETDTEDALAAALLRFRERSIDVLAVCGGDGSFHTVVSHAVQVWADETLPLLLPLRGGTMNNLLRSLHARRRHAGAMLAHVVKDYRHGRLHDTTEGDLIVVNGRWFGFIAGAGMFVAFLRLYYAGRRPGPLFAAFLLAKLGLSYFLGTSSIRGVAKPVEADVTCDGQRLPFRRYTLLLASTMPHIGLGLRPFYLGGRKRGHFHVLAGPATPGELLARLWRFYRGFPAELPSLYDNLVRHMRVEFAEPQCFTLNGDVFAEPVSVLDITAGPRVRLIRG
jgi:diacylglycerol kinase family enzyme